MKMMESEKKTNSVPRDERFWHKIERNDLLCEISQEETELVDRNIV